MREIMERDEGMEKLCKIYLELTNDEKEKIIRLGEGLLKSQKTFDDKKLILSDTKENAD